MSEITESKVEPVSVPVAKTEVKAAEVKTEKKEETDGAEPMFLRDRLDRERKSVLKDLGIKLKRGEDAQERLEEFRAELDADKTSRKSLAEDNAKHILTIEKLSAAQAAVKVFAELEFNGLSEAQKTIVKSAAGDDPNERLKTIAMMKATGMIPLASAAVPAPAAVGTPATPAVISAPAQTAPAAPAPAVTPSTTPDVRAEYARLQSSNPLAAAAYLLQNRLEYFKQP